MREALDRVGTRAGLELPRASWPLTAREAKDFLDRAIALDSTTLSAADSLALRDLLSGPKELWRWENGRGGSILALNLRSVGDGAAPDTSGVRTGWRQKIEVGGAAYGNVGGEIWFLSDARILTEWNEDFKYGDRHTRSDGEPSGVPFDDPSRDGRYESRTAARYVAWAQWSRDWISLKYGRDRVRFGPGHWTGLTTRLETPPYNMLDSRFEPFPWLSVQATVLEARIGELEYAWPKDARKWAHVHRFEVRPLRGLELAFQNQVLYRDSGGVNPTYLVPLVPIFFSQDLAGNRDNAAFQLDFRFDRFRNASVWSALLLDDLNSLSDILSPSWLNRWAILAGGRILSPWRSVDADLVVEWTMVRPWTYTGGREEAFTFAHYGMPMGSELGPDSRTFRTRLAWRPVPRAEGSVEGFLLEKGRGSQATLGKVHSWGDGEEAELFGTGWDGRTGLVAGARIEPWRDVSLRARVGWVREQGTDTRSRDFTVLGWGWEADW